MWYEDANLLAVAITAAVGVGICAFLKDYLEEILTQYSGSSYRGVFWAAIAQVLIVMVPISLVIGCSEVSVGEKLTAPQLLGLLKWGFYGLVGTVILLSVAIGIFGRTHGATIQVDPEDADDLRRILVRIRELRARELLERIEHVKTADEYRELFH